MISLIANNIIRNVIIEFAMDQITCRITQIINAGVMAPPLEMLEHKEETAPKRQSPRAGEKSKPPSFRNLMFRKQFKYGSQIAERIVASLEYES